MPFLGYYGATSALLTSVSNPPLTAVDGDTITGIWQDPVTFIRTARNFVYSPVPTPHWNVVGSITSIDNVMAPMYPVEGRYLSVLDPNGLGMFATNFAYVNTVRLNPQTGNPEAVLANWGSTAQVGQDILEHASDLEVHDIFTGAIVTNMPSTLGLLPIYIRSNGTVVGVGSAVYNNGSWVVLWYKMAISAGAAPRPVYDTATIIYTNKFKMIGDTSGYTLVLHDNTQAEHEITGDYDGTHTEYDFTPFANTWVFFTVFDSTSHTVYMGRRGLTDATYDPPNTGELKDMALSQAIAYISDVLAGVYPVTINHKV